MTFARFAIYYAPDTGDDWAALAAAWLGWDIVAGRALPHPDWPDLPLPAAEITATPRKYGLHGTLKPPFRLADGHGADALRSACAALAARLSPVRMDALALGTLGRFLALTPRGDSHALAALASACVADLDSFRAPAPESELARRRAAGLSAPQEAHLVRWGYPYVMDQFRFHVTLTGPLAATALPGVRAVLERHLGPLLPAPFVIGDIALAGEDADGRFHLIERFALTG